MLVQASLSPTVYVILVSGNISSSPVQAQRWLCRCLHLLRTWRTSCARPCRCRTRVRRMLKWTYTRGLANAVAVSDSAADRCCQGAISSPLTLQRWVWRTSLGGGCFSATCQSLRPLTPEMKDLTELKVEDNMEAGDLHVANWDESVNFDNRNANDRNLLCAGNAECSGRTRTDI